MKLTSTIPILRILDQKQMEEFYLDYLGFKIDWEYRHTPELPLYLQVSKDTCKLHLSEHKGDATVGSGIRIECNPINVFLKTLKEKQFPNITASIQNQPWGCLEIYLIDPFGNQITFFQREA